MIQNIIHTDFSCKYGIIFFVICIRIEKWSDIVETRQNRYFNITKYIPYQYIWERLHKNLILIKFDHNKLKHCNKVQLLQTEFFHKTCNFTWYFLNYVLVGILLYTLILYIQCCLRFLLLRLLNVINYKIFSLRYIKYIHYPLVLTNIKYFWFILLSKCDSFKGIHYLYCNKPSNLSFLNCIYILKWTTHSWQNSAV